jgi:hypothetical protein
MDKLKYGGITALGALLCIAPPIGVTCAYFPLWVEKSSSCTVSGLSLLFILVSIIPIFRIMRDKIATPAAPIVWIMICLFAFAFRSIIDQVIVISFVGCVSSIVGMIIFKLRDKKFQTTT